MKLRLSLMYFSMFMFIGVHMPFWPLWLQSKGLIATQIAILTSISFALKIFVTPIVAKLVDKYDKRKSFIILLSLGLFLGLACFFYTNTFIEILIITILAFSCWSPIMAITESIATSSAKKYNFNYGAVRMWGSIAFTATALCAGKILGVFGNDVLLISLCSAAFILFMASCYLPKDEVTTQKSLKTAHFTPFIKNKWFILFILATTLIQGSHAFFYTFGSIKWRHDGISAQLIGMLWALGFGIDILVFAYGKKVISQVGAFNIIIMGGVAAMLRWCLIGASTEIWILICAQLLQALSFAASHFAAMAIITEHVDKSISTTGQGIYSSFIMGLGMGVFVLISGPIYSYFGNNSFFIAAIIALLGVILAFFLKMSHINKIGGEIDAIITN